MRGLFPAISPADRTGYLNTLLREVVPLLSDAELRAMLYLVDRAHGWLQIGCRVRYSEFECGLPGVSSGAGLSKKGAMLAIKRLEDKGFIRVKSSRKGTEVRINSDLRGVIDMLKVPKSKSKTGAKQDICGEHSTPLRGTQYTASGEHSTPPRRKKEVIHEEVKKAAELHTGEPRCNSGKARVEETIALARKRQQAALAKRTQRARSRNSSGSFYSAWADGLRAHFGADYALRAWSPKERGQAMHLHSAVDVDDFHVFLTYCAENWYTVVRSHAYWATQAIASEEPSIGFLLSCTGIFLRAYNDRDKGGGLAEQVTTQIKRGAGVAKAVDPRTPKEIWEASRAVVRNTLQNNGAAMVPTDLDGVELGGDIEFGEWE